MEIVEVAVGIIKRNNQIYISKRSDKLHQGGLWEFPGGKREGHESIDQALVRELREEIGIEVTLQQGFLLIEHDYGDKKVRLDVRLVTQFLGEPTHLEGQISRWMAIGELDTLSFPVANTVIVEKLQQDFKG